MQWSVVIPAFNEAVRLPRYLEEVVQAFDGRGDRYEVIVVDDASTDATSDVVQAAAGAHPAVRLLRLAANLGKGGTVRAGMLAARGHYRLFTDADGATPIAELKRLEAAMAGGADVAIGSRVLVDPSVAVTTRPHRVAAGRVFNWIRGRLGLRGIADSQCGFKLFRGPVAEDLFGRLRTQGFAFDVEILLLAQRAGYLIAEVPVNWTDQPGSKVHVLTDGPRMVAQILMARLRVGATRGRVGAGR
ncbi:MAG: glycosyltransferase family 2 protein [Candidatus Rokubacteria bacterium]|nr:glycosyltransferase family 2 protein [Candidatus Rokubacteria bacterium]